MNETNCGLQNLDYPVNSTANAELRNINIQPLSRGYILNVGCQSVAISTKAQLKEILNAYIDNPQQVEEYYYAGKFLPKES